MPITNLTNQEIASNAGIDFSKLGLSTKIADIPLTLFRKEDGDPLPTTPASPNFALKGGTWATDSFRLQSDDLKTLGATSRYGYAQIGIPDDYVAGNPFTLRVFGFMLQAVANVSAVANLAAYLTNDVGKVTGAQLAGTPVSEDINSLTGVTIDYQLTATTLNTGKTLIVRLGATVNDGAGATAVEACFGRVQMVYTARG